MTEQYVVVYMPHPELVAEAVGPFRSQEKAERARKRIHAALDRDDLGTVPQVVRLTTTSEAVDTYRTP